MINELEKQFFDTFGIECNISFHQQFNGAQVPRGLEFYKKREELAKTGIIKIWHKMLNPRPENDCVYWGEYHYPQITDRILLELIKILSKEFIFKMFNNFDDDWALMLNTRDKDEQKWFVSCNGFKDALLSLLMNVCNCSDADNIKHQVRTLFEEG